MGTSGRARTGVRTDNMLHVIACLRRGGSLTVHALCEETGLTPPTVTSILRRLQGLGWVTPASQVATGGRKARSYRLNGSALQVVAVDRRVHELRGAVYDVHGNVLERDERPVQAGSGNPLFAEGLVDFVDALVQRMRARGGKPVAVGLSLPVFYDDAADRVTFAPSIGGEGLSVAGPLQRRYGVPVVVENDARAAAFAEAWWSRPGHDDTGTVAFLLADYGVGVGVCTNGELYRGRAGAAGDIGHAVIDPHGRPCGCGQTGCLETVISFPALCERLVSLGVNAARFQTVDQLVAAALAGDRVIGRVLEETARYLAVAASIVRILFDPDEIVLGGGLGRAGSLILPRLQAVLEQQGPAIFRRIPVRAATYGLDNSLAGAAALAFRRFLDASGGAAVWPAAPVP